MKSLTESRPAGSTGPSKCPPASSTTWSSASSSDRAMTPHLQDLALVPDGDRVSRRDQRAEGRALVGRAPPRAPPLLGPAGRSALAEAGILGKPHALDPAQPGGRDRRDQGFREVPRASLV